VSGTTLYVADYSNGIFAIDRRTTDVRALKVPLNVSLLGVDGLYAADAKTLIATQNGTNPFRILRINARAGRTCGLLRADALANSPLMGDPTSASSQTAALFQRQRAMDLFGDDGRFRPAEAFRGCRTLRSVAVNAGISDSLLRCNGRKWCVSIRRLSSRSFESGRSAAFFVVRGKSPKNERVS
jgi:hypothetical protein